jgi:tRNA(Phe) wybutosine-synthesizing methylase Tyw3
MKDLSITEKAQQILKIAEEFGVEKNFLFITTFKRYIVQLSVLQNLENTINKDGALVTKEYVKGRENVYTHPAIGEYNKTSQSANGTVATLIKIIKTLRSEDEDSDSEDELLNALGIR